MPNRTSKKNFKTQELLNQINRLTELWLEWMQNHRRSNDIKLPFGERRKGGEKCETLQQERQQILEKINHIVETQWMQN